jgi:enoyl-CoA hydratase/carnithine racemase
MIEARLDGSVGWIVRRTHNAFDRTGIEAFGRVVTKRERQDALRAVVPTGRGHSFCAGASLGEVAGGGFDG